MDGIQLIRFLDVLQVTGLRNAPGVVPRSLIVTGPSFKNADTVLMNGLQAPSFIAYSATQLIAEVPAPLQNESITDVVVLSAVPSLTGNSLMELTIGSRIRKVSGVQRLVQNFVRLLMRTSGSNIFHPNLGGGLMRRIGANITTQVAADVAIAIDTTKKAFIAAQTPVPNIPPEERLLAAEIADLTADQENAAIYVTIVLTNFTRQRAGAALAI